jgi:hypothetical protein
MHGAPQSLLHFGWTSLVSQMSHPLSVEYQTLKTSFNVRIWCSQSIRSNKQEESRLNVRNHGRVVVLLGARGMVALKEKIVELRPEASMS